MPSQWPIILVLVAGLSVAGCVSSASDGTGVEEALRGHISPDATGLEVVSGSCDDQHFEKDGLHLWECDLIYPATVLTERMERRWNVAIDADGFVVDASPK